MQRCFMDFSSSWKSESSHKLKMPKQASLHQYSLAIKKFDTEGWSNTGYNYINMVMHLPINDYLIPCLTFSISVVQGKKSQTGINKETEISTTNSIVSRCCEQNHPKPTNQLLPHSHCFCDNQELHHQQNAVKINYNIYKQQRNSHAKNSYPMLQQAYSVSILSNSAPSEQNVLVTEQLKIISINTSNNQIIHTPPCNCLRKIRGLPKVRVVEEQTTSSHCKSYHFRSI